jgi:hypothetical protein
MNNDFCIFCRSSLDGSDEHILPVSINGRLHSKKLICHNCNTNYFGTKIDPSIKKLLNPLWFILGWDKQRTIKGFGFDGERYSIEKGGNIRHLRPIKNIQTVGRQTIITATGDKENVARLMAKEVQIQKEEGKVIILTESTIIPSYDNLVRFEWAIIPNLELSLLLNKISLEFFTLHNLEYSIIEALCRRVRHFDANINNVIFCNLRGEIREFGGDEVSHLIVLKNDESTRSLFVYIELFNLICCIVILSENYTGEDIEYFYYQDALSAERFFEIPSLDIDIKMIIDGREDAISFNYLNNYLSDRLRYRDLKDVVHKALELKKRELSEDANLNTLKPYDFDQIIVEHSAKIVANLIVYQYPYLLDDVDDENDDGLNYIHSNFRKEIADQFCEDNKEIVGCKLKMSDGIYEAMEFFKQPIVVKKDKELIKIFIKVIETNYKSIKYLPVRDVINSINKYFEQHNNQ